MNINKIVELILSLLTYHTTASKSSSKSQPSPFSPTVEEPKLKLEKGYYIWNKGYVYPLSDHFSTAEFDCNCSYPECKEQKISKILVNKLELIRIEIKQPLGVSSAFRCAKKQQDLRDAAAKGEGDLTVVASKTSTHELGDAVDIYPKDRKNVRTDFLKLCASHFDSIGLSDRFLHVDQRKGHRRWNY